MDPQVQSRGLPYDGVAEQQAADAARADPSAYESVRRPDAGKSFLGLQVELGRVPAERVRSLVEEAWRQQAPKRLVAEHDRHKPV